jgi:hypothetical protein
MRFKSTAIAVAAAIATAGTLAVHPVRADPDKLAYELQERCGKDAAEFFRRLDLSPTSFTNHYNPDLNGCFALVNKTLSEHGKGVTWVEWDLWDVNENRQLDMFAFKPNPEDLRIASQPRSPSAPEPRAATCLVGNFTICDQGFAEVLLRYMQRSSAQ